MYKFDDKNNHMTLWFDNNKDVDITYYIPENSISETKKLMKEMTSLDEDYVKKAKIRELPSKSEIEKIMKDSAAKFDEYLSNFDRGPYGGDPKIKDMNDEDYAGIILELIIKALDKAIPGLQHWPDTDKIKIVGMALQATRFDPGRVKRYIKESVEHYL